MSKFMMKFGDGNLVVNVHRLFWVCQALSRCVCVCVLALYMLRGFKLFL